MSTNEAEFALDRTIPAASLGGREASSTTQMGALDTRTIMETGEAPQSKRSMQDHLPGSLIGKYEIRSLLGRGGMGVVYLAFDPLIEREVALKLLSRDLLGTPMALQRFLGEAKAIGRLNHPNVVSIFDIGEWQDQYYLIMELLTGGCVADKLEEGRPLPWQEACRISAEAATGLSAAHLEGMVHRDIKPENLMLSKNGIVKVVDFGLSKLLDTNQESQLAVTTAGQLMGTPHYMSPEQLEGNSVDARTDLYSLGATFFRLLTGRFPYHDATTIFGVLSAHMNQPVPKASDFVSGLPSECDRIIARAMAKDRKDRFGTAAEMAAELNRVIYQEGAAVSATLASVTATDRAKTTTSVFPKPLSHVVLVEPSKLQGAVIRNSLKQWGVTQVVSAVSMTEAKNALAAGHVDLLMTSQQLEDGLGIDLIREFLSRGELNDVTAVLNSSDVSLSELSQARGANHVVLAPKRSRPEDALRLVHAMSSRYLANGPLSQHVEASSVKLTILSASGRIPRLLQDLIREVLILEVDVKKTSEEFSVTTADLKVLFVESQSRLEAAILDLSQMGDQSGITVVVSEKAGQLQLAGAARQGVVYLGESELNSARFLRILQSCRS